MKPYISIICLALALAAFGCAKEKHAPDTQAPSVNVTTATVEMKEIPDMAEAVGTVEARRVAELSAKLMGTITELSVEEGQGVASGAVVARIDAEDIKAKKREAEQAKVEGQAALKEADAALSEAKAARENVEVNVGRMTNLYNEAAVTKKELDDITTQRKMADAKVEQVEARVKQVEAKIEQAKAAINQTDVMLGYAVVRSPISGVVVSKSAERGEMAAPGRPLLKVADTSELRLSASVKEGELKGLKKGEAVKVIIDALGGKGLDGRVAEVVPSADPATRSFTVKVGLPREQGLLPGMFGRLVFPVGVRKALIVPEPAIVTRDGEKGVFVVGQDGTIYFQVLRLGDPVDGGREALSGLAGGERVVTGDTKALKGGEKAVVR